jgi:hypothetical protein
MNMKSIMGIISLSCIIAISFCFYKFHGGLSNTINDWACFGNYISGTLMPILTIINIWVFIKLTNAVSNESTQSKRNELSFQKKLVIAQLRQKELYKFMDILNKSLVLETDISIPKISMPVVVAITYLESFVHTQSELFPIINDPNFNSKILKLKSLLNHYYNGILEGFSADNLIVNTIEVLQTEYFKDIMNCKGEVISALQKFVLDDI